MSNTVKRLFYIYIFLFIYMVINCLIKFTSLAKIYISILNPLFLFFICALSYYLTKGFQIRNRNKYSKRQNVIIIVIGYFLIYYLSGLVFGFLKNGYSLSINGIITNFISYFLIVIFKEYIRYKIIFSTKKKFNLILVTIFFILLDIEFNYLIGMNDSISVFEYFFKDIVPIIIMNITSTYLIYKIDFICDFLYRGVLVGISLFSPILPDHQWIISNFLLICLLLVLVFSIDHLVDLEDKRKRKREIKKENPYVTWFMFFVVFIFILFIIGFFKYQPIAILSDSMKNYYSRGDVVVVEKINRDDVNLIKMNDIIYYKHDNKYITHRVVDIKLEDNLYKFYTKGDNNASIDDWEVRESDLIGIVKFKIKFLGWPSVWFYELMN